MLSFFFYGTLIDPDIRAAVLGGPSPFAQPATLSGFRRAPVAGRDYPGITPASGHLVDGLLATGISPFMAARMSWYEGDEYQPASRTIITDDGQQQSTWVYVPRPTVRLATGEWSLTDWQHRRKRAALGWISATMHHQPKSDLDRSVRQWRHRDRRPTQAL